ncbi:MAG: hypothetical protein KDC98_24495 [Planctomycetes bacterium]|nr:hypothetical protein [Planctomycetota bacterium]
MIVPSQLLSSLCLLSTALLLQPALHADELRLADGRVLVGNVVEKAVDGVAVFEVHTRDGVVVVACDQVLNHRKDDELRQDLDRRRANAGSTPFAFLQLAIEAHSVGLESEMWRYLDTAVTKRERLAQKQQTSQALDRLLSDFLAQLEPEILPRKYRTASTETRVKELLGEIRVADKPSRALAIAELLVREPNAEAALRKQARHNTLDSRRVAALQALARRAEGKQEPTRFVLRTTILDPSEEVRQEAAHIVRDQGQATTDAIEYLAPGLMHQNAKVRVRTAEAFAELGHDAAIEQLVAAGPTAGMALVAGGGTQAPRAHAAFINQQAYIRDFDVEVAQAAFIADPKVDVLQSGSVLDVTVTGVFEVRVITRAYRRALKSLAGSDPGPDPRKWAGWHSDLLAKRAAAATTPERK